MGYVTSKAALSLEIRKKKDFQNIHLSNTCSNAIKVRMICL